MMTDKFMADLQKDPSNTEAVHGFDAFYGLNASRAMILGWELGANSRSKDATPRQRR